MNPMSPDQLDDWMDRYVFGLLDEASDRRTRRRIESNPAWRLAYEAAVTRQRADGTPANGWHPQHRVTVAEAIQAYTATPAAVHHAFDLGLIAPGNQADLVVLSENILTSPSSRIPHTQVDMTLFNGQIMHRRF